MNNLKTGAEVRFPRSGYKICFCGRASSCIAKVASPRGPDNQALCRAKFLSGKLLPITRAGIRAVACQAGFLPGTGRH